MASFDVNSVLHFLRRNGFVEAESALQEDLLLKWGNEPLGYESLPGLPPVRVGSGSRNLGHLNDIETDRSGDSGLFMSAGSPDGFCFSSGIATEGRNTNELSPASLADSTDSCDSGSEFVTAYDYSVPSDLECDDLFELGEFHRKDFADKVAESSGRRKNGGDGGQSDVQCIVGAPSVDKFTLTGEVNWGFQSFRQEEERYDDLATTFATPRFHSSHPSEDDLEKSHNAISHYHVYGTSARTVPCDFMCNPPWGYWGKSSSLQQDCVDPSINFMKTHLVEASDFSLVEDHNWSYEMLQDLGDANPFVQNLDLEGGKDIKAYEEMESVDRPYDKKMARNQQQPSVIHSIEKLDRATSPSTVESSSTNLDSEVNEQSIVGFKLSPHRSLEEIVDARDNSPRSSLHIRVSDKPFRAEAYDDAEAAHGDRDIEGCEDSGTHVNEDLQETSLENQMPENFEDDYGIFELRVIHRRNRTGFELNKDIPITLNTVIAGRYYVTDNLGSAAFSHVIQARDLHTGVDVCLKIIKNSKDYFDQSLDEIKLLKLVNRCDPADRHHIVRLYDYFYYQEHLFIVCELLKANLYKFQKFNQERGPDPCFTRPHLQAIAKQCLEALDFLHGLGIIHCDIKPENILIKSYRKCEVKIIDLGSSCFQTDNLCSYVQSRSYRAPEIILGLPYDGKIDIWSLGCVLVELFTGHVLFPNVSLAMLLARIIGTLGPIDIKMLEMGQEAYKYFTDAYDLYHLSQDTNQIEFIQPEESSLQNLLADADIQFIEFIYSLLRINPESRLNAREALRHPWMSDPYEPVLS